MWVCRNPIAEVGGISYALCIEDDLTSQLEVAGDKPDPIVKGRRPSGKSCGSGSYFISKKFPYVDVVTFDGPYSKRYACNTDGEISSTSRDSGGILYQSYAVGNMGGKMYSEDTGTFLRIPASCYAFAGKVRHGYSNFNWIRFEQILALKTAGGALMLVKHVFFCTQRDSGTYSFGIGTDATKIPGAAVSACERAGCNIAVTPGQTYSGGIRDSVGNVVMCTVYNSVLSYEKYPDPPKAEWKFDDDYDHEGDFISIVDLGILPGEIRNLVATAYSDATERLPEASANSIMNVIELARSITSVSHLVKGGSRALEKGAKDLLKSASDPREAWLTWRYVYNTTKMDLQDYRDITRRCIQLVGQPTFKISAERSEEVDEKRKNKCKVTRTLQTADFDVGNMSRKQLLETYGFKLSAYNLWDMVPYSFIVDWFIPIGDMIQHAEQWTKTQSMHSMEDWISCSFQFPHGYTYMRWHGTVPSLPPIYSKRKVGAKTLVYRLADTISIFTGR